MTLLVTDPQKATHTPGPWLVNDAGHVYAREFYKPAPFTDTEGNHHPDHMGGLVALVYCCFDSEYLNGSREANAEFIVRAVNSHQALVEAVHKLIADLEHREPDGWMSGHVHTVAYDAALAALALAEGGRR